MSAVNDKIPVTSAQLIKKLKSIQTEKLELKTSLFHRLEKFHCLDQLARSIGVVDKNYSYANKVSWNSIFSSLSGSEPAGDVTEETKLDYVDEVVTQSSAQLETDLIPALRHWRNKWMLQILFIDMLMLVVLASMIAGVGWLNGVWNLSTTSLPVTSWLYERPLFIGLILALLIIVVVTAHFILRKYLATRFARTLADQSAEFNLAAAFLKNTRLWHSIFRPDIVGLNGRRLKCLASQPSARQPAETD